MTSMDDLVDEEVGNCSSQDFDNPFADILEGDNSNSNNTTNNNYACSLRDQVVAEEAQFLLDFDNLNTPKMQAPRSRTASEPMVNPLLTDIPLSTPTPTAMNNHSARSSKSLSRRRGGASSAAFSSSAPSVASISTASTTSSSIRANSQRPGRDNNFAGGTMLEEVDDSENDSNNRRVRRASLDSGMAAVRRWIRSRSSFRSSSLTSQQNDASKQGTAGSSRGNDMGRYSEVQTSSNREQLYGEDSMFVDTTNDFWEDPELSTPSPQTQQENVSPSWNAGRTAPPTIPEEQSQQRQSHEHDNYRSPRQRTMSEPDAAVRDFLFQRALTPHRGFRQLRYSSGEAASSSPRRSQQSLPQQPRQFWSRTSSGSESNRAVEVSTLSSVTPRNSQSSRLSSSAVEVLFSSSPDADSGDVSIGTPSGQDDQHGNLQSNNSMDNNSVIDSDPDPQREARARWRLINRRFQVVITVVALIFSLLLFAILVCWVVVTSAYVVSIDKPCDVPLKAYFWLATLQLILDVFRTDIMRCIFRWDANSNQRIPSRVITYNIAYLVYACLVLRMGIQSVFVKSDAECRTTAPELYKSSTIFVSLSIAAWSTIILGYLLPFCVVATLLTLNGYTPSTDSQREGGAIFPTTLGAPPGCVDQLRVVQIEDISSESARECCICMEVFSTSDTIVETECHHRYHKNCLTDWLRQARTCPVCRMDVVPTGTNSTEEQDSGREESNEPPEQFQSQPSSHGQQQENRARLGLVPVTRTFGRNTDIHHEVVSLFQIIRRSEMRNRQSSTSGTELRNRSGSIEIRNRSMSQHEGIEDGHNVRQY